MSEGAWARVREIGRADLVVGIPSYNNARTIAHVVRAAAEGIAKHFPGMWGVIVDSDGGSTDGTGDVVAAIEVPSGVEKLILRYQGPPGKGSAFRAIFEVARALGARACVVVDSDLRSITPDWIRCLASPVVSGEYGYVAPYYTRHKFDGTITNSLCYPVTRALYGISVRQPIGGDFGFASDLLDHYLGQDVWETEVARFGIDIWMTTTAINEGFKVGQARLGIKVHDPKDPAASLGPMFRQVVGTLFGMMARYQGRWTAVEGAVTAPLLHDPIAGEPEQVAVNVPALVEKFRSAYQVEAGFWRQFLPVAQLHRLGEIAASPNHRLPADLWASLVYDFAVAYNRGDLEPARVAESLTGLYYGRTAAFCQEVSGLTTEQVEEGPIEQLSQIYQQLKTYLVRRWEEQVTNRPPSSG